MKHPYFSIIIPVYKTEAYIDDCVNSVLSQSFSDYEIILVDDGSPDNCPKICDNYANTYNNITAIHKTNGGLSSARNAGLPIALGKYILFLDSDDYYLCDTLKTVYSACEKTKTDVICFGYKSELSENGKTENIEPKEYSGDITENLLLSLCYSGICLCDNASFGVTVWNKAFKHSVITDNNLRFDETVRKAEDLLFSSLFFSIAKTCTVISNALYFYRFNKSSLTHEKKILTEQGIERSCYIISQIDKSLNLRGIERNKRLPPMSARLNRIIIDFYSQPEYHEANPLKRIAEIKQAFVWYKKYTDIYNLIYTANNSKKYKFESNLIKHNLYLITDIYTQILKKKHSIL